MKPAIPVIATANKMNDIEEEYSENVEKEEEIFLDGLQKNRSLGELEKEYSKKVREIRRIYEKSIKKELNEEKEKEIQNIKNRKKSQEKKEKEFHVQNLNLEKSWKDKKQIEIESWKYKTKRKTKNFIQKAIPNSMIYSYYKTKRILGDFFRSLNIFLGRVWEKTSETILGGLSLIKEGFIKIIADIKRIAKMFKRKNGKKEGAAKKSGKQNK